MGELKDWILHAGSLISYDLQQRLNTWYDSEMETAYHKGCNDQRNNDVVQAIKAFISLKADDGTIYRLLSESFGINDISLASDLISYAKYQIVRARLKALCLAGGMTNIDFRSYEKEHHLKEKVKANPKLLDVPDEKLRVAIEKK